MKCGLVGKKAYLFLYYDYSKVDILIRTNHLDETAGFYVAVESII